MVGTRYIEIWQRILMPLSLLHDQHEGLCGHDAAFVLPTSQDDEGVCQIRDAKVLEVDVMGEGGKSSLL